MTLQPEGARLLMWAVSVRRASRVLSAGLLLTGLALSARPVHAQVDPDPSEGARVRVGSFAFTPAVVLSAGHDSNVYREPNGFNDTEMFAVPQIEGWWTRPGFRITVNGALEVVRFGHNVGATNSRAGVRWDRTASVLKPYVTFDRRNTNANPTGFEVGYKSLRLENDVAAGGRLAIGGRTHLAFTGRLTRTRWDADARYQTSSLMEKLNRDTYAFGSGIGYAVTPLTSIGARVEKSLDRFRFSPVRDGETLRVFSDVEFARPALVFGGVSVGYQQFSSPHSGAADFTGLITSLNLGHGRPDGTLFKFYMSRDTQYSFDTDLAYYVMTGMNVTVSRRVGDRWDAAGFANRFMLDYRPAGTVASIDRVDRLIEFGGALAYRVGRWARIGVTGERARRTGSQEFEALRVAAFLTYGSGRFLRLDRPTPFER